MPASIPTKLPTTWPEVIAAARAIKEKKFSASPADY